MQQPERGPTSLSGIRFLIGLRLDAGDRKQLELSAKRRIRVNSEIRRDRASWRVLSNRKFLRICIFIERMRSVRVARE